MEIAGRSREVRVVSYHGYRNEETPRMFFIDGEEIRILKVIRMWKAADRDGGAVRRYFKVKGSDGYNHAIYYDEYNERWFLPQKG